MAKPDKNLEVIQELGSGSRSFLTIVFAKSPSTLYAKAVKLAQSFPGYQSKIVGKIEFNLVNIEKPATAADIRKALTVIKYASKWKSTKVFCSGSMVERLHVLEDILYCYLESLECDDYRAHCHVVIDEYMDDHWEAEPTAKVLIPCRVVAGRMRTLDAYHPSSYRDQAQAIAVKQKCNICPRFNADDVREMRPGAPTPRDLTKKLR